MRGRAYHHTSRPKRDTQSGRIGIKLKRLKSLFEESPALPILLTPVLPENLANFPGLPIVLDLSRWHVSLGPQAPPESKFDIERYTLPWWAAIG